MTVYELIINAGGDGCFDWRVSLLCSAASAALNQASFITLFHVFPAMRRLLEGLLGTHKGSDLQAASILLFLKMSSGQLLKQPN